MFGRDFRLKTPDNVFVFLRQRRELGKSIHNCIVVDYNDQILKIFLRISKQHLANTSRTHARDFPTMEEHKYTHIHRLSSVLCVSDFDDVDKLSTKIARKKSGGWALVVPDSTRAFRITGLPRIF